MIESHSYGDSNTAGLMEGYQVLGLVTRFWSQGLEILVYLQVGIHSENMV